MAIDLPHISYYDSLGFRHFEYVVKNVDLIMLIIRVTKSNMDSFKKIRPIGDLKQHKIGDVIGSFWKRNLADISGKDGTIHRKKVRFGSFPIKEVIFEKPLRRGAEKEASSVLTSTTDQNYGFPSKNKNCEHSEKSLL